MNKVWLFELDRGIRIATDSPAQYEVGEARARELAHWLANRYGLIAYVPRDGEKVLVVPGAEDSQGYRVAESARRGTVVRAEPDHDGDIEIRSDNGVCFYVLPKFVRHSDAILEELVGIRKPESLAVVISHDAPVPYGTPVSVRAYSPISDSYSVRTMAEDAFVVSAAHLADRAPVPASPALKLGGRARVLGDSARWYHEFDDAEEVTLLSAYVNNDGKLGFKCRGTGGEWLVATDDLEPLS